LRFVCLRFVCVFAFCVWPLPLRSKKAINKRSVSLCVHLSVVCGHAMCACVRVCVCVCACVRVCVCACVCACVRVSGPKGRKAGHLLLRGMRSRTLVLMGNGGKNMYIYIYVLLLLYVWYCLCGTACVPMYMPEKLQLMMTWSC
jgi:hypothetical protein